MHFPRTDKTQAGCGARQDMRFKKKFTLVALGTRLLVCSRVVRDEDRLSAHYLSRRGSLQLCPPRVAPLPPSSDSVLIPTPLADTL